MFFKLLSFLFFLINLTNICMTFPTVTTSEKITVNNNNDLLNNTNCLPKLHELKTLCIAQVENSNLGNGTYDGTDCCHGKSVVTCLKKKVNLEGETCKNFFNVLVGEVEKNFQTECKDLVVFCSPSVETLPPEWITILF